MERQVEATNRLIEILGSFVPGNGTRGTALEQQNLGRAIGLARTWLATHGGKIENVRQAASEAGVSPSTMQRAIAEWRKSGRTKPRPP